jgi:glutamate dehydrogenase/leucine dehydrogenase
VGVTLLITGMGFSNVTVALLDRVGSSTLVAVTVTVLGVGNVRGAV